MAISERRPTGDAAKKFTLRLGDEAVADLDWIAKQHGGITITEVLKRALATEKFLLEQQKANQAILLEDRSNGRQRELIFR